jgi:hypothetical protein
MNLSLEELQLLKDLVTIVCDSNKHPGTVRVATTLSKKIDTEIAEATKLEALPSRWYIQ